MLTEPGTLTDEAWQAVLRTVDETYSELVAYQNRLEQRNEELTSAKRLIESVLSSVSDIMVVVERDGTIAEVSQSLLTLVDAEAGQVAGRPIADIFAETDRPRIRDALDKLRLSQEVAAFEIDIPAPDGPQPYDIALSARLNARGKFAGVVLTGRPLGELRRAYAELERSHQQLKEAQTQLVRNEKLASLGRLLAGVAHELNNPISFVYASVHALEKYVGQFETYFRRVQEGAAREELVALRAELKLERNLKNLATAIHGARDGAERVRDIVADLRRLAADGPSDAVAFDLVDTARVAASWVERGAKRKIAVEVSGAERIQVRGVPGHVQQIVMNLVQNAFDAVGGVDDPHVAMRFAIQGDMARLTVEDNGPGVPEHLRASVFDPFFTTKDVGEGTGLGLSISAKIAHEHSGSLSVGPGPGGQFTLELPLDQAQTGTTQ